MKSKMTNVRSHSIKPSFFVSRRGRRDAKRNEIKNTDNVLTSNYQTKLDGQFKTFKDDLKEVNLPVIQAKIQECQDYANQIAAINKDITDNANNERRVRYQQANVKDVTDKYNKSLHDLQYYRTVYKAYCDQACRNYNNQLIDYYRYMQKNTNASFKQIQSITDNELNEIFTYRNGVNSNG